MLVMNSVNCVCLRVCVYDKYGIDSLNLNQSDQISVPVSIWEMMVRDHKGDKPLFVMISGTKSVIGRIRPSTEYTITDSCLVPQWMLQFIYEEPTVEEQFVEISPFESLCTASHITLRAHREADLTSSSDPIAMLTEALSSRVCITVGTELPLSCGVFDVMRICCNDIDVQSGCIMDCDVNLEFVPALDHVEPEPEPEPEPKVEVVKQEIKNHKSQFIPFSGTGHKLGS